MGATTPIRGLYKPTVDEIGWADAVNANMDNLDTAEDTTHKNVANGYAGLDAGGALPNGSKATTQTAGDNSTKLATTAYVATAIAGFSSSWSSLTAAAADLTLANSTFNSTFNHTAAVDWVWANTTVATAGGTVSSSPRLRLGGHLFSGGADVAAFWSLQHVPATSNSKAVTNISETAGNLVTLTVGASHGYLLGDRITIPSLTVGSWLNGQNAVLSAVAATTITFTDPTAHGAQASTATVGTVTQIPNSELQVTAAAGAAEERVIFPAPYVGAGGTGPGSFSFAGAAPKTGFGLDNATFGGMAIYTVSSSNATVLGFYSPTQSGASAGFAAQRGIIAVGDNSAGNQGITMQVGSGSNFCVGLLGGMGTGTANAAVVLGNNGGFTATSGAQIGVAIGLQKNLLNALAFQPTSGTAAFKACVINYSINQTGGANGAVTALMVNATETAVGGTHNLLDLQAGAAGTTSKFAINNSGRVVTCNGEATAGVGTTYARGATSQKAETGADANVLTVTPAAAVGTYRITIVISVSAATAATLGWTATWTDSNGNAQTPTNLSLLQNGVAAPALTFTTSAAGNYCGVVVIDVNNAGTNIVVKTTFSGTSVAYKVTATIERIA
jgi:hypothetical protein